MEVEFSKLPNKALRKINSIMVILDHAEAMMYEVILVDYNNGLIRLENGGLIIDFYASTFTVATVDEENKHTYRKNLMIQEVVSIINEPRKNL